MPSINSDDLLSLEHVTLGQMRATLPKKEIRRVSSKGEIGENSIEDDNFSAPYKLLPGEFVQYYTKFNKNPQNLLILSNFRLFVQLQFGKLGVYNILLRSIDSVECREILFLYIFCKDGRVAKILFDTSESCVYWFRLISAAAAPPACLDDLFAFTFFEHCMANGFKNEENRDLAWRQNFDIEAGLSKNAHVTPENNSQSEPNDQHLQNFDSQSLVEQEFKRLKFDPNFWRITGVNQNYDLCPTYPKFWIVPATVTDQEILEASRFRSLKRVAAVVWRHRGNGAVLIRCSQPETGIFGWRSPADENLLQAIHQAASSDRRRPVGNLPTTSGDADSSSVQTGHVTIPTVSSPLADGTATVTMATPTSAGLLNNNSGLPKFMLILDARSYAAAWANRAKGGGFEHKENYQKCEIQFLGLANIHAIRSSFAKLRALIWDPNSDLAWFQNLDASQWSYHLWSLLNSALRVVEAVHLDGRSVLVHCSDGWDRTTQIISLAKLLLDSYYRTMKGFKELIEREWIAFGHKFGERSGLMQGDVHQRAPVFLQWLDCVRYLLRENPCSFEFNEIYLVKLAQHAYSGLFGTFLCNSACEFVGHKLANRTFSIWSYLHPDRDQFRNLLYVPHYNHNYRNRGQQAAGTGQRSTTSGGQGSGTGPGVGGSGLTVLIPRLQLRDLGEIWRSLYCPLDDPVNLSRSRSSTNSGGAGGHHSNEDLNKSAERSLTRAHSCDDLINVGHGEAGLISNVVSSDAHHHHLKVHRTNSETSFSSLMAKSNANLAALLPNTGGGINNSAAGNGSGNETPAAAFNVPPASSGDPAEPFFRIFFDKRDSSGSVNFFRSADRRYSGSGGGIKSSAYYVDGGSGILMSGKFRRRSADDASLPSTPFSSRPFLSSLKSVSRDDLSLINNNLNSYTNGGYTNGCTPNSNDETTVKAKILSAMNLTILNRAQVHQGQSSASCSKIDNNTSTTDLMITCNNPIGQILRGTGLAGGRGLRRDVAPPSEIDKNVEDLKDIEKLAAPPIGASSSLAQSNLAPPTAQSSTSNRSVSFDIDGLKKIIDPTQQRIKQIIIEYERRLKYRQLEIDRLKVTLQQNQEQNNNGNGVGPNGPKSIDLKNGRNDHGAGDLFEPGSLDSRASEMSWEAVDEQDTADRPILWVPDHASTRCTNCDAQFWAIKRRHHCRNCGKVFCSACTNYECPVPQEQFFQPVRVCYKCYDALNTPVAQLPL